MNIDMNIEIDSTDLPMASATDRGLAHRHSSRQAHPHEPVSVYVVSKVSIGPDGRVAEVLWGQVDTARKAWSTDSGSLRSLREMDRIVGSIGAD
ncbi:MAG: hypothetical protein ABI781_02905 [Burkholderiales bacterium]